MSEASKKLVLIDANALMHRAYHALPPLTTKKGEMVNAVYGFTSVLLKVIKELKPDYMVCAFDVAGKTFRDEVYENYKAGRVKPDQEFYDQIPKIKEVVKALNIPILEKQGFEADDVIGSLVKQVNGKCKTIIVTGDLDVLQLVDKNTEVYTLRKGIKDTVIYDEEAVNRRYGLKPSQIVDFKGLRGDPSDNIPGVEGIGEKRAVELLKNFGSVENLYRAIEKGKDNGLIKPKVKEKLIQQKDKALMSKKLAVIRRDLDLKLNLEKCSWGNYDKEKLSKLFQELEFYSLMSRIEKANNVESRKWKVESGKPKKYVKCVVLDTDKKVDGFLAELKKQKRFVFQTKSIDDGIGEKKLEDLVFLWEGSPVYYIPLAFESGEQSLFKNSSNSWPYGSDKAVESEGMSFTKRIHSSEVSRIMESTAVLEKLKPILENEKYKKVGYFLKQDVEVLYEYNIDIRGLDFDIMLAAYLLNPGKRDYSKDKIIFDYLGCKDYKQIGDEGKVKERIKHASEIAKLNHFFELYKKLKGKLKKAGMDSLFYKIEMPLIKVLVKMETNGIKLDVELLKIISSELEKKISKLDYKIHKLAGDESFNINSSQQLAHILFERMKLPTTDIKRTQTGYSVAATELEKLKDKHIIINFISQYRELVKLKSTYVDALPKLVSRKTNRLHTTFHQTVTATGRLSSSDPNLQNIPIRTEIGREIRKAFVAEPKRKLLSADYSQIELRIIAVVSGDKRMKEIFEKGIDVHAATAAEINQVSIREITPEMRRAAKALNFGMIYGMSVFGFAQSAGIGRDKAKKFIDSYMRRFSGVARYIEESKKEARKKGYAETLWGRRRYLPELNSSNALIKNSAERMAINMPIQGTAADIIKIAMVKIEKWIENYNKSKKDEEAVKLLLQVHDELVFSVKEENIKEAAWNIKKIMESKHLEIDGRKIDFSVPIEVDIKIGDNWEEMEKII
jgi:DNA polymerase-1